MFSSTPPFAMLVAKYYHVENFWPSDEVGNCNFCSRCLNIFATGCCFLNYQPCVHLKRMQNTEIISCSFLVFMQHCMWSSCCSCPIPWFMAPPSWTPPNTGVLLIHYEEFVRLLPFSWLSSTSVKKSIKWESKLVVYNTFL